MNSTVLNYKVLNKTEDDDRAYPTGAAHLAFSFCIIYAVFGISANLLTIVSVLKSKNLRSKIPNIFVVNLAVADFMFCAVNLPVNATRYASQAWILGDVICQLFPLTFYTNLQVSMLMMMLIAINRYIGVVHSQRYKCIYTKAAISSMIVFCWIYTLSLLLPVLLGKWGEFGLIPEIFDCDFRPKDGKDGKNTLFIIGAVVPLLVIVTCYLAIFISVQRRRRRLHGSRQHKRYNTRLTITLVVAFVAFLFCLLPITILQLVAKPRDLPYLFIIGNIILWSMSVINPVIYGFLNKNYRHAYAATLNDIVRSLPCSPSSALTLTDSRTESKNISLPSSSKTSRNAGQNSFKEIMS